MLRTQSHCVCCVVLERAVLKSTIGAGEQGSPVGTRPNTHTSESQNAHDARGVGGTERAGLLRSGSSEVDEVDELGEDDTLPPVLARAHCRDRSLSPTRTVAMFARRWKGVDVSRSVPEMGEPSRASQSTGSRSTLIPLWPNSMATNPPFFTGDEDEDEGAAEAAFFASLGLPDYDNPVSVPTPYDSRVGGAAVWFGGNGGEASSSDGGRKGGGGSVSAASRSAGTYGPPSCTSCGAQLFLVAQIYAPVEYARALAIFGCNRPECSRRSSTWRVIRTQDTQDIDPWKLAQQDGTTGQGESVATSTSADNANSGAFTKSASMVSQPSTSLLQYREVAEATKARVDGMETSGMIDGKDGDGGVGVGPGHVGKLLQQVLFGARSAGKHRGRDPESRRKKNQKPVGNGQ